MKDIAIIMGSDSDLPVMSEACKILEELDIGFDVDIVSAHRTPQKLFDFAKKAHENYKIIIAGAGGAAHLPGMVASITHLPVIGVPIRSSSLNGVDSLHSIVQMPRGVPVATMAINGSTNAALFAARIIALNNPIINENLQNYISNLEQTVAKKSKKLDDIGYIRYLE